MRFSRAQLMFVLILYIGISNHVLIMPHLLSVGKRDAWISVLVAYPILLFWGFTLYLIMRKNKQRLCLYDWIEARAGGAVSQVIMAILAIYVFSISALSFYDLIQSINIYFLPRTPSFVVMLPFLLISVWSAYSGLKSIVYVSAVLLPMVWMLGIFVAWFTLPEKDYSYLFPILANGYQPIIKGTTIILGGSADLLVLLLLQHHLKKPLTLFNLFLFITILVGLILGPTMGSLSSFGPSVASDMRFPAFEQWRLITLGEYISHVDFLAVFQLLSGEIIRVSLGLYLIGNMLKGQSPASKKKRILVVASLILGSLTVIPLSDIWVQTLVGRYFYPAAFLFGIFISLALLIISYLPVRKGTQNI
ncbi:GerAB/ArcD/ProY family transporter [Mesobacillus selenatarsenatis]|uniref:Spore germination protein XB n=1 Tax=Mesobacillus selenatarsenatis (strain DSM 18680 / JCM 14380 / FERM P-15431 / SF-1) TaxID=1321606 RepID=A0A0A8X3X0_MESS1|nr:endospore germination permease [Mesobacillus selenatarsenatis]GAM14690.1 spore germination protein XB [Mesobacillus selenatarsenatis SF-1]